MHRRRLTIGSFVIGVPIIGPLSVYPGSRIPTYLSQSASYHLSVSAGCQWRCPYSNMAELGPVCPVQQSCPGAFWLWPIPTRATFVAAMELGLSLAVKQHST
ncbi:MAG: hypothetical protein Ct9H300mP14_07020 [Gammaproteobacteria bacterium]|nr:MAG: hypothetical protein Ct9H300mP14_07020 [Gammaproteobacteria bacterium]